MRLTRIEIENFKGIGERQAIDLKPITLLFGANSAGKSTVLQALHYVREILERGNPDPDQTIAGGLIDLGGFATLVHNHDLNRAITIKLVIDLSGDRGSERLPLNSGESLSDPEFTKLQLRYLLGSNTELRDDAVVKSCSASLRVRWSELLRAPYVESIRVELDEVPMADIYSPPQAGRAEILRFNFWHPLLQEIEDDAEEEKDDDPAATPLGQELYELARGIAQADPSIPPEELFRVKCSTDKGALPNLDQLIWLDLTEVDEDAIEARYRSDGTRLMEFSGDSSARAATEIRQERLRRTGMTRFIDELVLGPLRIVRDHLQNMTYIGPLREIPRRGFRPRLSPDESRWAHGLAAWDLLYADTSGKLLAQVNHWMSGEGKLDTDYALEKFAFKEVPVPSRFHQIFERGLNEEDLGELQELYASLAAQTEIALRDLERGIVVAPSDVGVGISQMVPVIVASLRDSDGILAVEQPELHVHPAIQVGLGELFIEAIQPNEAQIGTGKSLLIETHSEHIMLRLLRRIREQSGGNLPPGARGLTTEELSVIYVENSEAGVRFVPLQVTEDGDFLDRWPKGFFEERAEELF